MVYGLPTGKQTAAPLPDRPDEGDAAEQLRILIERIERLVAGRLQISREIERVYEEARDKGFSVRLLRKVVVLRQRACRRFDQTGTMEIGGQSVIVTLSDQGAAEAQMLMR